MNYDKQKTAQYFVTLAESTCDSYSLTNVDTYKGLDISAGGQQAVAQSFNGNGGYIVSAKLKIRYTDSASSNIRAEIRAISGTHGSTAIPSGSTLAYSDYIYTFDYRSTTVDTLFVFSGSNRIQLTSGTKYVLLIEDVTAVTAIEIGVDSSSPAHSGNASYQEFFQSWNYTSTYDIPFEIKTKTDVKAYGTPEIKKTAQYYWGKVTSITKTAEYTVQLKNQFNTGWLTPNVVTTDSTVGTLAWNNTANLTTVSTTDYADYGTYSQNYHPRKDYLKAVVDDVIVGNNVGSSAEDYPFSATSYTLGGTTNNWGNTITPAQANNKRFGFALAFSQYDITTYINRSNYIVAKDFRLSIPPDATIVGIEARITYNITDPGGGLRRTELKNLEIRVHYTWYPRMTSSNMEFGYLRFDEEAYPTTNLSKSYQVMVYDKGTFVGEWKDVIGVPNTISAINSIPSDIQLTLYRAIQDAPDKLSELLTNDDEIITDEQSQTLYVVEKDNTGVGSGTNLDVNYDVILYEYYGSLEPLVDEDGEALLSQYLDPIGIPVGYPSGRTYFRGFVSSFEIDYSPMGTKINARLLHHADELNQVLYQSLDTVVQTSYNTTAVNYQVFGGNPTKYPSDIAKAAQTFTTGSSMTLGSITARLFGRRGNVITAKIIAGIPSSGGSVLGQASAVLTSENPGKLSFSFANPISLSGSTLYSVIFESSMIRESQSEDYPAQIYVGSTLGNGSAYYYTTSWTNDAGTDYSIEILSKGGSTTVTHNSTEPSEIFKKIIDYNKVYGGYLTYTNTDIDMTNTVVSAKINTNTLKEALDYTLKLCPADWFYLVEAGEWNIQLREKPSIVTHRFALTRDIVQLRITKTIENLVNTVYFTGGGNPALFIRVADTTSINTYRSGLRKLSDNRVTDSTTASILSISEIDTYKNPLYIGQATISRQQYTEIPHPGEVCRFQGFGNYIDMLDLLITKVTTTPNEFILELGIVLPKVLKRVEDIKRNLNLLEVENNPSSPS